MSIKQNIASLQNLLEQVNALPEAGGSSDSEMINVSVHRFSENPVFYLDSSGMIKLGEKGTEIQTLHGIVIYYGYYTLTLTGDYIASKIDNMQVIKFKADGGSIRVN
jgi:hypothetical protein